MSCIYIIFDELVSVSTIRHKKFILLNSGRLIDKSTNRKFFSFKNRYNYNALFCPPNAAPDLQTSELCSQPVQIIRSNVPKSFSSWMNDRHSIGSRYPIINDFLTNDRYSSSYALYIWALKMRWKMRKNLKVSLSNVFQKNSFQALKTWRKITLAAICRCKYEKKN